MNEIFEYDETSPSGMRWKVDRYTGHSKTRKHISAGDVAGHWSKAGYWTVNVNNKAYYVHRVIMELHGYDIEGLEVDHRDKNRSNNKLSNLRVVPRVLNSRNITMRDDNSSGVTGVVWQESKYSTVATACWQEAGRQSRKSFSVGKYGLLGAFAKAVQFRKETIQRLNTEGYDYTEGHGNGATDRERGLV